MLEVLKNKLNQMEETVGNYERKSVVTIWEKGDKSRTYFAIEETCENSKHYKKADYGYLDNITGEYVAGKSGDLSSEYTFDISGAKFQFETVEENKTIDFKWTKNYDENMPNNGFDEQIQTIECENDFYLSDYLILHQVKFEQDNDMYFVLDGCNERTGEAYMVV